MEQLQQLDTKTASCYLGYALTKTFKRIQGFPTSPKYGPIKVNLEVARTCNLLCPMCLRSAKPLGSGFMNLENCKRVVAGFPKVMGVGINGWGELLLNPEIIQILQHISGKGLLIAFNTNGLLLKNYASDLISIKHLYHVGLSLDSLSTETKKAHDALSVLEAFEELAKLKKRRGKKYPILRVSMTVMNSNVSQISDILRAVAKSGDIWFDMHPAMAFKKENTKGPNAPPAPAELSINFEKAVKEGNKLGIRVTCDRQEDSPEAVQHGNKGPPCLMGWESPFVDYTGDVHSCCFHVNRRIGNAIEKPLREIWKSAEYRKYREELLHGTESFCNNCISGNMWKNFSSS